MRKKIKRFITVQRILSFFELFLRLAVMVIIVGGSYLLIQKDFLSTIHFATINDLHSSYLFGTMNKGEMILLIGSFIIVVLSMILYFIKHKTGHIHMIDKIYLISFFVCFLFFFSYTFILANPDNAQICIVLASIMFLQKLPYTLVFYLPYLYAFLKDIKIIFISSKK